MIKEARVLSWSHIYVYLWDDESPRRLRHRNLVNGAAWNNDGTRILSWSWDGTAQDLARLNLVARSGSPHTVTSP